MDVNQPDSPDEPMSPGQRAAGYVLLGVACVGVLILVTAVIKAFSWVFHF